MMHFSNIRRLSTHGGSLCILTVLLFAETSCVSRSTYDQTKTDTQEHTRALGVVREDVKALEQQIAGLRAANQREEALATELRTVVQREEDLLPIRRQQAEETFLLLKTQVATLMNQSWNLARKIVDIRQESASLQTMVAQYKHKLEQKHPSAFDASSDVNKPLMPPATMTEAPFTAPSADQNAARMPIPQTNPATPTSPPTKQTTPSPSVSAEPPSVNDSWIDVMSRWLSSMWKRLFG
jgi:hypothetical protein